MSPVKWPTSIAEICGDDESESAQKLRRKVPMTTPNIALTPRTNKNPKSLE